MLVRDLDLVSVRLFVAVCEEGNLARAADRLAVVPSAASKRMAQLSSQLGVSLLSRYRWGVRPTAAGQTLLEHARDMLAAQARIERAMSGYAAGVSGEVRVFATASVLAESLADDVAEFLTSPTHSDIRVSIDERVSPDVVRGVCDGNAALGICWDIAAFGELTTYRYRSDRLIVVVHPAHPLAKAKRVSFIDTLDFEQVSMPPNSAVQVMLARAAAQVKRRVQHRVVVSNFEAALRAVRANLALSVVPEQVAEPYVTTWSLRAIALTDDWAERRFAICHRTDALTPAATLLRDHLIEKANIAAQHVHPSATKKARR
jgi:DNA-binding transcriptional LysR family regulator